MAEALLNRHIAVIDGTSAQRNSIRHVSDLRSLPFVVLLGEPGIGKSTVFGLEASREGTRVLKVRELLNGSRPANDKTLYLDALDEYRIDGQPSDKVHDLAQAIDSVQAPRWRLSCRSEDWRKSADIAPIQRTTAGEPIIVAQLLPLDREEAGAILAALGEDDPETFLTKADALGASGFVENPLSLKLLRKAIAQSGAWPKTRFDLFQTSILGLAYERSSERARIRRSAPESIIQAAGEACLVLLVSGARAVWRSNDEPPDQGSRRDYVTGHELQLDNSLLRDVLDTALFRGEGDSFEPMHRTVAEFLGAQVLAKTVTGSRDNAAFPLSRALALISDEGKPPTELRGLYAWFAAHLAKLGDQVGARHLIELDAVTVLAYGDAAVFETEARRSILRNLDRDDPYFNSSDVGATALGGLAGEDISDDLAAMLAEQAGNSHRLLTALEALSTGHPVASVRPFLRSIALDSARPEWQRWRAADAWLNGAVDMTAALRELFDVLASEPTSGSREALRAHIAEKLPTAALSKSEIRSILADFSRLPEDNMMGRLFGLSQKLQAEPRQDLFDEPLSVWLSRRDSHHGHLIELGDLLDQALAALIHSTPTAPADQLWQWIQNARESLFENLRDRSSKAVAEWLEDVPGREVALFQTILAQDDLTSGPWTVGNYYIVATGRRPSRDIVEDVLESAKAGPSRVRAKRLIAIAVEIARSPEADVEAYWKTYDCILTIRGVKRLLLHLTKEPIPQWRRSQRRRALARERQEKRNKRDNIKRMAPILANLRVGQQPGYLDWAAQHYFAQRDSGDRQPTGIGRIRRFADSATIDAILVGWEYLVTRDPRVDAAALGTSEASGSRYYVEWAVIAGLDRCLEKDGSLDLAKTSVVIAIIVIKAGWIIRETKRRERLVRWAIDRLNLNPAVGASQLFAFWEAALDGGSVQLRGIEEISSGTAGAGAIGLVTERLLTTRPELPEDVLRSLVRAGAKHLETRTLLALAEQMLANPAVTGSVRSIWSFVAFALDANGHGQQFLAGHRGVEAGPLFRLIDDLIEPLNGVVDDENRMHREFITVCLLGQLSSPEDQWHSGVVEERNQQSRIVMRSINWLGSVPTFQATKILDDLVENEEISVWRPSLRHARAQQARLRRDQNFRHPTPTEIHAALAGGPPINAMDLRAVVLEELGRLQGELRAGSNTSWKRYWNLSSAGRPTTPLVENQCRDHLLDRLNDRLRPYKVVAALAEARRPEETRADMLVLSGAGRNLPIEVKRHFHSAIWTAASTQLQGYSAAEGADGFGIYLVFWFGNNVSPTPVRPDRNDGPRSAQEMQSMLVGDLVPDLRARTDVIVFDVSDPQAPVASARKARKVRPNCPPRR